MTSIADLPQGLSAIAARFGITRALVYAVLARTWSVLAGPVSLVFIGRFLSSDEQGFYYTFWSILGLWVFFDLGLSLVIVQFASHERASLQHVDGRMTGGARARQRLASLLRLALRWFSAAGLLMIVAVLPAGLIFFGYYRPAGAHVAWVIPWILLAVTSTINLLVGPFAAILEGSGFFQNIALMRLLQAMTANVLLWIVLAMGGKLYAAVALNGAMAVFSSTWIVVRYGRLFRDLWSLPPEGEGIHWRDEIWPFQWRFAVSWMTSYFMFQLFNPILFAGSGPREAGQMGMSLMVTTAIAMFAQAWVNTRAVDFGAMVAAGRFDTLDRVFRNTLWQSTFVVIVLSGAALAGVELLRWIGHPLAERILSPLPLAILMLATVLNHIVSTEAAYLRAFKREPFLVVFLPICVVTLLGSIAVVHRFGATGMVSVLAAAVLIIGIGGGTRLFAIRRREWTTH
jgi:hypothetical protein